MGASPPVGGSTANPVFGMVVIVIAMSIIPMADGLAKLLTARLPTIEIVWARYFFHFACLFPLVVWRYGRRTFRLQKPGFQILRGCLLLVATMCFFRAVGDIPLVDAMAVVFVYPFVVTAFSPLVLGEKVGRWRWIAVIVGFIGALIVIRPGFQAFSPAVLLALGTGVSYAAYVLVTRKMAGTDPPLVTVMITGLVGTLLSTLMLPFVWVMPSTGDLLILMLLGVLAAIGHYGVILAHEYGLHLFQGHGLGVAQTIPVGGAMPMAIHQCDGLVLQPARQVQHVADQLVH